MKQSSLKPVVYPDSMTVRIAGIVFLGFIFQVVIDNTLPTLQNFYESRYGGAYDGGMILPPGVIYAYVIWIFPVAFYSFTIPKTKLFQGDLFTTAVMLPLVWIDYQAPVGSSSASKTIHAFRHAFFSVPFMFMLHVLLPEPAPLPKQEAEPRNRRCYAMEHSRW
ncbi:hypothetical protein [Salibacterium halotolerans]|uniref:Uncharacterized protein n=1 Tax=Salibacterium halotolerans TaxID=1884432 RepID=A0A1I5XMD9_9BACI|nr:hypothetical protein [Salibacterium halotolerans]SFQ33142.1 hypothetical protein SAMN05518683_12938 [Salibacterium halotolerans]